jgi:Uma2 family endonuclease
MATTGRTARDIPLSEYPTGDGKPMAETPLHGDNMFELREVLRERYARDPMAYVSGNMMMYYVPNDKRKHISPDVFVSKGIPNTYRDAYFVWVEGKGPDVVFEISSASTRKVDTSKKYRLYQDVLHVSEYFLFDPYEEYLKPSLQGFRLRGGVYAPIEAAEGRLYSEQMGLEMGRVGRFLRLYDPATGQMLLTWEERHNQAEEARRQAEAQRQQAEAQRLQAEAQRLQAEAQRLQAEAQRLEMAEALRHAEEARRASEREQEELRRELEELRRQAKKPS